MRPLRPSASAQWFIPLLLAASWVALEIRNHVVFASYGNQLSLPGLMTPLPSAALGWTILAAIATQLGERLRLWLPLVLIPGLRVTMRPRTRGVLAALLVSINIASVNWIQPLADAAGNRAMPGSVQALADSTPTAWTTPQLVARWLVESPADRAEHLATGAGDLGWLLAWRCFTTGSVILLLVGALTRTARAPWWFAVAVTGLGMIVVLTTFMTLRMVDAPWVQAAWTLLPAGVMSLAISATARLWPVPSPESAAPVLTGNSGATR